ncbi:hypothetical protein [Saccharothrix sp. ST-888]|uniref:hypothetical protein n=1 Tax=Saccharothrix sp. ST-888 TaxID=1427391 RepID=UPI0005EC88D8|nr:hypothetical protein [Saccharothrix sp. ST-888]KJK55837.1 hypothetical protein UK12_26305 [Saccharothrix sp. ST-888]
MTDLDTVTGRPAATGCHSVYAAAPTGVRAAPGRVEHDLGASAYAELRALRDLPYAGLGPAPDRLPTELRPQVRRVVTENARVGQAATPLEGAAWPVSARCSPPDTPPPGTTYRLRRRGVSPPPHLRRHAVPGARRLG